MEKQEGAMVKLSLPEAILLHLHQYRRMEGPYLPLEMTQEGIALSLDASRSHVSTSLAALTRRGHVKGETARVQGKDRRVTAYELTPQGLAQAEGLMGRLREIDVFHDGSWTDGADLLEKGVPLGLILEKAEAMNWSSKAEERDTFAEKAARAVAGLYEDDPPAKVEPSPETSRMIEIVPPVMISELPAPKRAAAVAPVAVGASAGGMAGSYDPWVWGPRTRLSAHSTPVGPSAATRRSSASQTVAERTPPKDAGGEDAAGLRPAMGYLQVFFGAFLLVWPLYTLIFGSSFAAAACTLWVMSATGGVAIIGWTLRDLAKTSTAAARRAAELLAFCLAYTAVLVYLGYGPGSSGLPSTVPTVAGLTFGSAMLWLVLGAPTDWPADLRARLALSVAGAMVVVGALAPMTPQLERYSTLSPLLFLLAGGFVLLSAEVCSFRPMEYVEMVKTGALSVLMALAAYSALLIAPSVGTRLALSLWSLVLGLALASRWRPAAGRGHPLLPDGEMMLRAGALGVLLLVAGLAVRAGAVVEGALVGLPAVALLHAWRPRLRARLRPGDAFALVLLLTALIATGSLFVASW